MASETSTSLARAIGILSVLGSREHSGEGGIGVVRVASLLGREKSQVSRTLKELAAAGFVHRDPDTSRYRLGWRLFALAAGAGDQQLLTLAPAVLRRLVTRVGESAHLTVLEGSEVLTVMSENPGRLIQAASWIGRATPLHCTSAGRALLFDHPDDQVQALLDDIPMPQSGPRAPRTVEEVLVRLHDARRRGYVLIDEEFEQGHVAVAAPVRDFRGRTVAALNISAPKYRLGRTLRMAGGEVQAAANELTRLLTSPSVVHAPEPAPAAAGTTRRFS